MKTSVPYRPAFVPDDAVSPSHPGVGPLRRRSPPGTDRDGTLRTATWRPPTSELAPRLYPAWLAMLNHLAAGQRRPRRETVDAMVARSDVLPKTASKLIASAAQHGYIDRTHRGRTHYDQLTPLGVDHCRAVLRHEAEPLELDVTTEMMREKTT